MPDSLVDAVERLFREFEDQYSLTEIVAVVRDAKETEELEGVDGVTTRAVGVLGVLFEGEGAGALGAAAQEALVAGPEVESTAHED